MFGAVGHLERWGGSIVASFKSKETKSYEVREMKVFLSTIHIEVSFFSMSFTLKWGFLGGNVVASKSPCSS
jgi:hypothetical protein